MICRNCGAGLEADRIDSSLGIVTCSHCGSLYDIPNDHSDVPAGSASNAPAAKKVRAEVALPSRFKLRRNAGSMEVTWSAGGLFQALVLSLIAGGFGYVALTSGMTWLLLVSIALLYYAAVQLVNTHRLRVDSAQLRITQGPLPWLGNKRCNSTDIKQLYVTEHRPPKRDKPDQHPAAQAPDHYRLLANTHSNGRITILNALASPEQALWLEQEIERLLGIADERIDGEHS